MLGCHFWVLASQSLPPYKMLLHCHLQPFLEEQVSILETWLAVSWNPSRLLGRVCDRLYNVVCLASYCSALSCSWYLNKLQQIYERPVSSPLFLLFSIVLMRDLSWVASSICAGVLALDLTLPLLRLMHKLTITRVSI